jgi:hypothetical protein
MKSYWFPPTFLTGVAHAQRFVFIPRPSAVLWTSSPAPASEEYRVASEEFFRASVERDAFRTPEEAFESPNNTQGFQGMAASVPPAVQIVSLVRSRELNSSQKLRFTPVFRRGTESARQSRQSNGQTSASLQLR